MYVIAIENLFYTEENAYCWTADVLKAKQWRSEDAPRLIKEYWDKVHHGDSPEGIKPRTLATSLCGKDPRLSAIINLDRQMA